MDTIEWRESYKLVWDDFKAPPELGSPKGALTGSSIAYDAKSVGSSIECIVVSYFNRQRSWVQANQKTDYVLSHEQGHFDLYEIYTRKLRKMLSEKTFTRKNLTNDLKKIVKKVLKKADEQQVKYDKATGFAYNVANQKKWSKKIADELNKLSQYKNTPIILSVK